MDYSRELNGTLASGERRSVRLPQFDYRSNGIYFITLLTARRVPILGNIADCSVILSLIGTAVNVELKRYADASRYAWVDQYVIMPNHVHLLPSIDRDLRQTKVLAPMDEVGEKIRSGSVASFVAQMKSSVTKKIRAEHGIEKAVWHRNYYEHVVRNEPDLARIRKYIEENPAKWGDDRYHVRHEAGKGEPHSQARLVSPYADS